MFREPLHTLHPLCKQDGQYFPGGPESSPIPEVHAAPYTAYQKYLWKWDSWGGGRKLVPLRGYENSDSGVETPVPALFLGRGCSSTPTSRLGPDASAHGPSTLRLRPGLAAGSGLAAFRQSLLATSIRKNFSCHIFTNKKPPRCRFTRESPPQKTASNHD